MTLLYRYSRGMAFVFQGIKAIFGIPGLLVWAVIPFVIDGLILIFGFSVGREKVSAWKTQALERIFSDSSGWAYALLSPLLGFFFWVVFVGLLLYATFLLSTVIAAPFNAIMAEKTLVHYGLLKSSSSYGSAWLTNSLRMFMVSMVRSFVFALIGIILFVFSFIPLVNVLAVFGLTLIMAFDSMDYSFEAQQMGLAQRFKYFRNHLPEFSGMATMLSLSLLVPGLTLLLLPAAVVGGSWVMCAK